MAGLIVCRSPGDEAALFGALPLARPEETFDLLAVFAHPLRPAHGEGEGALRRAAAELGIRNVRLLPFAHREEDGVAPETIAAHLPELDKYERIYTHPVQNPRPLARRVAAAVGLRRSEVWTAAAGGAVDEIVQLPPAAFARRLDILNRHYPDLLEADLVSPRELRSVDLFQKVAGRSLYRYYRGYLAWRPDAFDYSQPWDLETSPYERERYDAELEVLSRLPWRSLTEVGACEGAFTERLIERFPGRRIVAYEPDRYFLRTLRRRVGGRAEVREGDCEAAGREPCDLLFVSSLIYYCPHLPYGMLETPAEHVVVSHAPRYHREILDPAFLARGFVRTARESVPPRIEAMEGLLEVRYGTEIAVWRRTGGSAET